MREVRRHMGNPSVPAIPSSDPPLPPPELGTEIGSFFRFSRKHGKLSIHAARASGACTMLELVQP